MQFIYGDKDLDYELIYTDGADSEAQCKRALIGDGARPSDMYSSLGFVVCDDKTALFYSVMADASAERENRTYVHAFTRETDGGYWSSGQFYSDMFTNFATQGQLDDIREERADSPCLTYNNDLLMSADDSLLLDRRALTEITALLYRREKVVISVDDETYSDDRVRVVMKQIFDTLTPSLRRYCSYAGAYPDSDAVIRIMPASMAHDAGLRAIRSDGEEIESSDCGIITSLASILSSPDSFRERGAFFINYEALCSGGQGEYDMERAEQLYQAMFCDDMSMLERIVDSYLSSHPTDKKEELTKFSEKLTEYYDSEEVLSARFEYKDEYLLEPSLCLDENRALLYRMMLFSDFGTDYIRRQMSRACSDLTFSSHNFNRIVETVKKVRACASDDGQDKLTQFFYRKVALPVYENTLLVRCRTFAAIRNQIVEKIDAVLSSRGPVEPSEKEEVKNRLTADALVTIAQYGDAARNFSLSDYVQEYVEEKMQKHNSDHMSGAIDGKKRFPSETVIGKLSEIDAALFDGAGLLSMAGSFEQAYTFQGEYRFVTDALVCLYIIRAYNDGKTDDVRFFADTHYDDTALDDLADRIALYDPFLSLCFALDTFRNYDRALNRMLSYIVINCSDIDGLGYERYKYSERMLCRSVAGAICSSEQKKNKTKNSITAVMKKVPRKSNVRELLRDILYICKKGKVKK